MPLLKSAFATSSCTVGSCTVPKRRAISSKTPIASLLRPIPFRVAPSLYNALTTAICIADTCTVPKRRSTSLYAANASV